MLFVANRKKLICKMLDSNGIILFGAGRRLYQFYSIIDRKDISSKDIILIDNDKKKWNQIIEIWGKERKVIGIDELKQKDIRGWIIVITAIKYAEILDQLEADSELNSLDILCYIHTERLELERKSLVKELPDNYITQETMMIPKTIHYCWFGGGEIPDRMKKWMESWHKYCPDYEIIRWDESNYDVRKCRYASQAYEYKRWEFVSDYARLDVIAQYGGIYLDTDVELIKGLDDLLYNDAFAGFESDELVNFGLGYGAASHFPIIEELVELYNSISLVNEDGELDMTACPVYQTNILKRHGLKCNGEFQIVNNMTIYPEKTLSAKSIHTMRVITKTYSHSIHHFDGSWAKKEDRQWNLRLAKDMSRFSF